MIAIDAKRTGLCRRFWPIHCAVIAGAALLLFSLGAAARAAESDPVVTGRDSLRSPERFPWYDADKDDIRPILLPREQPDNTEKRPEKSSDERQSSGKGAGSGGSGGGGGQERDESSSSSPSLPATTAAPLITWLAWVLIAVILCALAFSLIRAYLDREAKEARDADSSDDDDEAREEAAEAELPAKIAKPKSGLLEEARRQYEAGNYDLAIIYLYSYELLTLDRRQLLRLAKGKTNREYVRELADRPELQEIVANCLAPFEDVFFGAHPLSRERFEACWNEVGRFNSLVGLPT